MRGDLSCLSHPERGGVRGRCGILIHFNIEESVKKLEDCASAHRAGRFEKTLEGGSLDVMGNLRFQ
jgi:hypothetical protein